MGSVTIPEQVPDIPTIELDIRPRRWTREQYYLMAEVGLIGPDDHVELIDGTLFERVSPQRTPHTASLRATEEALANAFGNGYDIRLQLPITLEDRSEPEPDVAVVPGTYRDFRDHHPAPSEVRLVVEISDSSLAHDRNKKGMTYAMAGIADYWIVNVAERRLEVYRSPSADLGYRSSTVLTEDDVVSPLAMPNAEVRVRDLLP
jgi:Uma2 family endonuclease